MALTCGTTGPLISGGMSGGGRVGSSGNGVIAPGQGLHTSLRLWGVRGGRGLRGREGLGGVEDGRADSGTGCGQTEQSQGSLLLPGSLEDVMSPVQTVPGHLAELSDLLLRQSPSTCNTHQPHV